jgi:hypothetical protein
MANMKLDAAIHEFSKSFPSVGMSGERGWTNHEVKRALESIGCGMAVSNSEYVVAMGFFYRAQRMA